MAWMSSAQLRPAAEVSSLHWPYWPPVFRSVALAGQTGQLASATGRVEWAPERVESVPGRAERAPERVESVPGRAERAPEWVESVPGQAELAPERVESAPGRVERAPEWVESVPGRAERAPPRRPVRAPCDARPGPYWSSPGRMFAKCRAPAGTSDVRR